MQKWYQYTTHLNYQNLAIVLKVEESVIFSNKIRFIYKDKSQSYETCVLGKQYKIYNKKPAINRAIKFAIFLYTNLFRSGDTF